MKETELKSHIKNGASGGYLFFGDEDYMKSKYAVQLKNSVSGGDFAEYNTSIIEGTEYTPEFLLDSATSVPFVSEKKFVMLRDISFSALREKGTETFLALLERIVQVDYTVFVLYMSKGAFDFGTLPSRPSSIYKKLTEYLKPVQFDYPTPAKLRTWVERHFSANHISVPPEAVNKLIDNCGRDMWTLSGEIDKLCNYVLAHGKNNVDMSDLENVSSKTLPDDAFAIANAVLDGDRIRAFDALRVQKLQKEEPIFVLSSISKVWIDLAQIKILAENGNSVGEIASKLKMHEYRTGLYYKAAAKISRDRLEKIISLCRETDMLLKSSTLGFTAIERLIAQTL